MANPIYQTPSSYIGKKAPVPKPKPASSWGGQQSWGGWSGARQPWTGGNVESPSWDAPAPTQFSAAPSESMLPKGHMVTPDYSGILGSFTADARSRFGAGQQAMQAQRLSQAKATLNRLGVRDVGSLLEKVKAYGLTQADVEGAAANPWSELKALDFNAQKGWANSVADLAARGGFRSGASVNAKQQLDMQKARGEAQLTQGALEELSSGQFQQQEWERTQRDQMEQAIAAQQAQLASAYQPYWVQD